METWWTEAPRVMRLWAGNTPSDSEFALAAMLGILVATAVHQKVIRSVRTDATRGLHSAVTVPAGLALALAGTVAFNLLLLPHFPDSTLRHWAPVFCPVLMYLVLVIPLSAWSHRRNYFEALLAVALSVATAVALGLLFHGVMEAGRLGLAEFRLTRGRTDSINSEL